MSKNRTAIERYEREKIKAERWDAWRWWVINTVPTISIVIASISLGIAVLALVAAVLRLSGRL